MKVRDKPTESELDKELERYLDELMSRLSVVATVAKERGKPSLMYALNRAWFEIDKGRQL